MKILGQTPAQIFRRMPWQYQVVTALGSCFILLTIVYVPYVFTHASIFQKKPPVAEPVKIAALLSPAGVLDPSIAYDPLNKKAWMAYTAQEGEKGKEMMNTKLAYASPAVNCKNWEATPSPLFEGKPDNVLAPDGQTILRSGTWRVETPSLVYDPGDPGREWKLFAYKYLWTNDPREQMLVARHYGVIVYRYASDPAKEWSTEQWLFSPAPGYPPPPYEQMVLLQLSRLDPSLRNIVAYARPSVIYKNGVLVMTLSAFTNGELDPERKDAFGRPASIMPGRTAATTPDRIIMIASSDHGNSWRYVGTVLQKADLPGLEKKDAPPFTQISGGSLIEQEGKVYLAAALGVDQQRGEGTFIFGFDDLTRGLLHRDPATGKPAILRQIPLQAPAGGLGGGAAAYDDGCGTGLMMSQQTGNSAHFQIYQTSFKPIEKIQTENK